MADTSKIKLNKGIGSDKEVSSTFSHKALKTSSVYTGNNPGVYSPRRDVSKGEQLANALGKLTETGIKVAKQVNEETYQENIKDWRVGADNVLLKYQQGLNQSLKGIDFDNMSEDEIGQITEEDKATLKESLFANLNEEQKDMINQGVLTLDTKVNGTISSKLFEKHRNEKLNTLGDNISMLIQQIPDTSQGRKVISKYYNDNVKGDGFAISRNEYADVVISSLETQIMEATSQDNITEANRLLEIISSVDTNGVSWKNNKAFKARVIRMENYVANKEDALEREANTIVKKHQSDTFVGLHQQIITASPTQLVDMQEVLLNKYEEGSLSPSQYNSLANLSKVDTKKPKEDDVFVAQTWNDIYSGNLTSEQIVDLVKQGKINESAVAMLSKVHSVNKEGVNPRVRGFLSMVKNKVRTLDRTIYDTKKSNELNFAMSDYINLVNETILDKKKSLEEAKDIANKMYPNIASIINDNEELEVKETRQLKPKDTASLKVLNNIKNMSNEELTTYIKDNSKNKKEESK